MKIWAISDLHIAISTPDKNMEFFGSKWSRYMDRIKDNWEHCVGESDLVLVAGDISWATKLSCALEDLRWVDRLPGTKVFVRGNHDFWWGSTKKMVDMLPSSIKFIHNSSLRFGGVAIGGARLWESEACPPYPPDNLREIASGLILDRELMRLERSLMQLDPMASFRIVMTHFPPLDTRLNGSVVSNMFEKFNINVAVFGHLHGLEEAGLFGEKNGIRYVCTSADYINFKPVLIVDNADI